MNDPRPRRGEELRLTDHDVWLFRQGRHYRLYEKLGAHPCVEGGVAGARFATWAPNAAYVAVVGHFNGWDRGAHPLRAREDGSGLWEGFVPGAGHGDCYKYHLASRHHGYAVDKADPFAFRAELPPGTASRIWDVRYRWHDAEWMTRRGRHNALDAPMSVYEMHLGSWRRVPAEGWRSLSYRELARELPEYLVRTGFTHVEFLPVMEHPFYGSWGYQTTGYFAPTSRYGEPEEFMELVDALHRAGIGVILDWVPSHFPMDEHGLVYFDGTHLYEHEDRRRGFHPEWNSAIFNYGRHEVRSILISSALFWLDRYHADGLRVDAVASMLYLDYARAEGDWLPNEHGGRENLEAVRFLRELNDAVYAAHPDVQTIAEESTAWPMVSRPTSMGGLGFGLKWNMGWMHDSLKYFARDPIHRRHHHDQLTFGIWYAWSENYLLAFSHDEVVHLKNSLLGRMPGDHWQKFANLRLLYGWLWTHPGKKLLFMGGEFGVWREWNHDGALEWQLLEHAPHQGLLRWIEDLNRMYRNEPALHERDFGPEGFEWVAVDDAERGVAAYLRKAADGREAVLVVLNLTPQPRENYRVGVPSPGYWQEILNGDAPLYGGSGLGNFGGAESMPVPAQGRLHSLNLTLPPLAMICLKAPPPPSGSRGLH